MASDDVFTVKNISKSFGGQTVVKDICFTIKQNSIFTILGKNGAGKTTIIKMMLGLLKPNKGEILFLNKPLNSYKNNLYNYCSALLESVDNLYSYLTGFQNIEYFLALNKSSISKKRRQFDELVSIFNLKEHLNKKTGDYSRGMRQKLALLCSILKDTSVLFLDEPTLGLDFESSYDLLSFIKTYLLNSAKTIILTTHQASVLENLCDNLIIIDNQSVVYEGKYAGLMRLYTKKTQKIDEILYDVYKNGAAQ